jgi:hypothetical protein
LQYAIRRVHANQDGLKLIGPHLFVFYADDVNILGGGLQTVQINTGTLVVTEMEIGLEVNADKTKYMAISRDQNAGQVTMQRLIIVHLKV